MASLYNMGQHRQGHHYTIWDKNTLITGYLLCIVLSILKEMILKIGNIS